jgi:aconitate hydratase
LQVVLAKDFARIHAQNLVNFGILPLTFDDPDDYDKIDPMDELVITAVRKALTDGGAITVHNKTKNQNYEARHHLSQRQIEIMLAGGMINYFRQKNNIEIRSPCGS